MSVVLIVFLVVYLGMMLGHLPWLRVDRASVALGGAIALLATSRLTEAQALASIDFGTIGMLFGLMLISIQLRDVPGLYGYLSALVTRIRTQPPILLALLIVLVGHPVRVSDQRCGGRRGDPRGALYQSAPWNESGAVPVGHRLCRQCRRGGDHYRQSAEHSDRANGSTSRSSAT